MPSSRHHGEGLPQRKPLRTFVSAKIHNLVVTDASVNYHGSVTIGTDLLRLANIKAFEQVDIVNLNNGNRWTTYVLPGESGVFTLNGGGARLGVVGDRCVAMTYRQSETFEGADVVYCDENNGASDHFVYVDEYNLPVGIHTAAVKLP